MGQTNQSLTVTAGVGSSQRFFFDGAKYKKLKMSELNYESVSKMKVAELRSALEDHGLDSKGTKPILVARLQSYMENQPSQNAEPEPMQLESTGPEATKHKLLNTNIEEMAEETSP